MAYRDLARKHRWPQKEHDAIRETLVVQERIETTYLKAEGAGRPKHVCRLFCPEREFCPKPVRTN